VAGLEKLPLIKENFRNWKVLSESQDAGWKNAKHISTCRVSKKNLNNGEFSPVREEGSGDDKRLPQKILDREAYKADCDTKVRSA
jgi:hypothetical protein